MEYITVPHIPARDTQWKTLEGILTEKVESIPKYFKLSFYAGEFFLFFFNHVVIHLEPLGKDPLLFMSEPLQFM